MQRMIIPSSLISRLSTPLESDDCSTESSKDQRSNKSSTINLDSSDSGCNFGLPKRNEIELRALYPGENPVEVWDEIYNS